MSRRKQSRADRRRSNGRAQAPQRRGQTAQPIQARTPALTIDAASQHDLAAPPDAALPEIVPAPTPNANGKEQECLSVDSPAPSGADTHAATGGETKQLAEKQPPMHTHTRQWRLIDSLSACIGVYRRLQSLNKRRLLPVAVVCLCLAAIGGALAFRARGRAPAPPAAPALTGALPIAAPTRARVGEPVIVTVGPVAAANGLPATLLMLGSYGPRVYRAAFANSLARFEIPGDDTRSSGAASLIVTAGAARGQASLSFEPDAPTDPVTPLVGARSITADGRHWSMSVVVPFDRFGNPVADGTPVDMLALHPGDQLEQQHTHVRNMVAWARIFSRTRAGRTTVSAAAAGKHGPDATFMETPGWPAPFGLSASPENVPADGRQFVTLRTDVIRDSYGNAMLDGTLVTFVVEAPNSMPRMIPAYTLDGVAEAQLQTPLEPGRLSVRATIYDVESRPLALDFAAGPAVGDFPLEARVDAARQSIELTAGPLLGPLQQFIPDGTPVAFTLTDAGGRQTHLDAIAAGGYARAEVRLAALQLGDYAAEARVGAARGATTFQAR